MYPQAFLYDMFISFAAWFIEPVLVYGLKQNLLPLPKTGFLQIIQILDFISI